MSFASSKTYFGTGDGTIRGRFNYKGGHGTLFEYSLSPSDDPRNDFVPDDFDMLVWVGPHDGTRRAKVLKTVIYIAIDEDDYGQPIIEKWHIRNHTKYLDC